MDGRTDGRKEAFTISHLFFKKRGIIRRVKLNFI